MNTLRNLIRFNATHPEQSKLNYHCRALICVLVCTPIDIYFLTIDRKTTPLDIALTITLTLLFFLILEAGVYWVNKDPNTATVRSHGSIWFGIIMGCILLVCGLYVIFT